MAFNLTTWIDERLDNLGRSVADQVVLSVGQQIDNAVSNLGGQIANNANTVVDHLGGQITDIAGSLTVDTQTLTTSIVNAIKGLLPFPFSLKRG